MNKGVWNKKEVKYLTDNCGKVSIYELMDNLDRSKYSIKHKVRNLGLSTRFIQKNKYKTNYLFFETMTPQLSHFIGFWFADGNIYNNVLSFSVNIKDKIFLEKLTSQFSTAPVKIYKRRPTECIFSICDKKLISILKNKYNFIPNKSLTCGFPKYIGKEYMKYFLQGYFEGDGWIAKRDKSVGFMTGSELFYKGFVISLNRFNPKLHLSKKYYCLSLNVGDSYKFLNYIYSNNNTIKMKRKYDLYVVIKEYNNTKEKYITMWVFSKIVKKHNQTLYNWLKQKPILPDVVDKNGYKYYNINKLYNWIGGMS